jgi:O-antigen/teichoic acid export membrane protein
MPKLSRKFARRSARENPLTMKSSTLKACIALFCLGLLIAWVAFILNLALHWK